MSDSTRQSASGRLWLGSFQPESTPASSAVAAYGQLRNAAMQTQLWAPSASGYAPASSAVAPSEQPRIADVETQRQESSASGYTPAYNSVARSVRLQYAEVETQPWASSASGYTPSSSDVSRLPMSECLDHPITREQRGIPITVLVDIGVLERCVGEYSFQVPMGHFYGKWEVDDIKRKVVSYLWSKHAFATYRRYFHLDLYVPALNQPGWRYIPYDCTISEVADRYHVPKKHVQWQFRLKLNQGRTVETCQNFF